LSVGETGVVRHVVQRVETGVNVLHEQREGKGGEKAEGGGAEVGRDLRGLAEAKLGDVSFEYDVRTSMKLTFFMRPRKSIGRPRKLAGN
jgi:hypothetical protein